MDWWYHLGFRSYDVPQSISLMLAFKSFQDHLLKKIAYWIICIYLVCIFCANMYFFPVPSDKQTILCGTWFWFLKFCYFSGTIVTLPVEMLFWKICELNTESLLWLFWIRNSFLVKCFVCVNLIVKYGNYSSIEQVWERWIKSISAVFPPKKLFPK